MQRLAVRVVAQAQDRFEGLLRCRQPRLTWQNVGYNMEGSTATIGIQGRAGTSPGVSLASEAEGRLTNSLPSRLPWQRCVMPGTSPTDLFDLAQDYLEACVDALDTIPTFAPALGGAPERSYVAPGLPALDCCPQLTVDVRAVQEDPRSPSGPGSGQRARYDARKNNVFMVATIVRCYPTEVPAT